MLMSGDKGKEFLARIKKINCASLPPCTKTLLNHIKSAQYVARMWKRADETNPTGEVSPTDNGWKLNQNCFEPDWFPGSFVPESLTCTSTPEHYPEVTSTDDEESDNDTCSDDSDDSDENEEEA